MVGATSTSGARAVTRSPAAWFWGQLQQQGTSGQVHRRERFPVGLLAMKRPGFHLSGKQATTLSESVVQLAIAQGRQSGFDPTRQPS